MPDRRALPRYAWLSMAAAVVTIALKGLAFVLAGSVGLLSDAIESFVNLAGAAGCDLSRRPLRHPRPHGRTIP
jgi:divalent metal cation (Fe/Co/Zn/Cd) transporter